MARAASAEAWVFSDVVRPTPRLTTGAAAAYKAKIPATGAGCGGWRSPICAGASLLDFLTAQNDYRAVQVRTTSTWSALI
jgi:hypothetical protein